MASTAESILLDHNGPWTEQDYWLQRGHYTEVASSSPGQPLPLAEPFPVDLDLAALATATRPGRTLRLPN